MKHYQITWAPECPQDKRDEIAAKMAAIKPRVRRPISHARARALAESRGERALAKPDSPVPSYGCIVRIYYRSMGGELLAFDAGPVTYSEASTLRALHDPEGNWGRCQLSDAVGADVYGVDQERDLRHGARLVTLPSQMRTEITEMAEMTDSTSAAILAAEGIGPYELAERLRIPSGDVGSPEYTHGIRRAAQTGDHFRTAMARRGDRLARWSGRSAS